ncbi:MAG: LPS-assembly protein LptD [Burkholderiales bacterium]
MSFFSKRLALFAASLFAIGQSAAQQPATRPPSTPSNAVAVELPTTVSARRIDGVADKETVAEGDAILRRGEKTIAADWIRFSSENDEVEAKGNVRLEQGGAVITGPALRLRTEDSIGRVDNPAYTITTSSKVDGSPIAARGVASQIELNGEGIYRLVNASFTTCVPGDDSWYMQVDELGLDYGREVGTARWATIHFFGTPIMTAPFVDFSLNNQRKSGFLAPTFAASGKNGAEVSLPYYLNLAPNRDLTITPRYMVKRGLMVSNEFRYLEPTSRGNARFEFLPQDEVRGGRRSAISVTNAFASGPYSGGLSLNKVSDNDYFRDLSSRLNFVSQTYLPREGFASYSGNWWGTGTYGVTTRAQSFQTLQPPNGTIPNQYSRLPQVLLSANRPDIRGLDFAVTGEAVDFHHPTQVRGVRSTLNPSISLPLLTPGAYITPKIGFHSTSYSLTNTAPGAAASFQRSMPIVSVDSGLTFERDAAYFGQAYQQTLEPRAFYLKVPYKDQSAIPLFDTAVADFNYAQIFSENGFTGGDRVNDANQVTLALTSRLLAPSTGQEAFRATIAQRYYFGRQQVTLNPATPPRDFTASDWLASVAGRVAPAWTVEGATQYSQRESRIERLTLATRFQPEVHKTLNLSYRFLRDQFNQIDASGQWPLAGRVYGVGRYNYSMRDHRVVEALAGFEYNADCWIGRFVFQRFASAAGVATHTVFLQIELNGFSKIGSDPFEALRRNIPGYSRLNQAVNSGRAGNFDD